MTQPISDVAFTPSVKAVQTRLGSRDGYARMEERGGWNDQVTPQLAAFLAEGVVVVDVRTVAELATFPWKTTYDQNCAAS